jgi:hypothetical protein
MEDSVTVRVGSLRILSLEEPNELYSPQNGNTDPEEEPEERTEFVTTNLTSNQRIQFDYDILECVQLNFPVILNLMKRAQPHVIFNTLICYEFYSCGDPSRFFETKIAPRREEI